MDGKQLSNNRQETRKTLSQKLPHLLRALEGDKAELEKAGDRIAEAICFLAHNVLSYEETRSLLNSFDAFTPEEESLILQKHLDLPNDLMFRMFIHAGECRKSGYKTEAANIYFFLTFLNPTIRDFKKALQEINTEL